MSFFGIFDQICLILVFLGKNFLKNYCHIWNHNPRVCQIPKFRKKTKMHKFRTKNALFRYLCTRNLENYCHVWNQHLRICLIAKFCEETKMPKFGTKMPFLSIFDQECLIWVFLGKQKCLNLEAKPPFLGIFDQECLIWVFLGKNFKKLLWDLKPAPLNLSNCKISWNNENSQIWDQKCLIWVFYS